MKNKRSIISWKSCVISLALFFAVAGKINSANASGPDPFYVTGHYIGTNTYTRGEFQGYVTTNKAQYAPGETINVSALVQIIYFSSGGCNNSVNGTINGVTKDLFSSMASCKKGNVQDNQFTAETTPGNYNLTLTPSNVGRSGGTETVFDPVGGGSDVYTITVPYTVVAPAANGSCGSSNNIPTSTAPTSGFCNTGTEYDFYGSGPWSWSCIGQNGGSTASCNAPLAAGSCGADNTQYLTSTPTNLCTTGTASLVSGTGPWSWTCGTAACSANIAYECYNVCSYTDNPWNYAGANFQATDAACTAPTPTSSVTYSQNCACGPKLADLPGVTPTFASLCAPVTNGSCDSTTDYGKAFTPPAQPTILCSAGTPSALTTTSSGWTWSCNGSNGGTNATSCYATQNNPINAQCGSDNGQTVSNPTNLCNPGTASALSGSGPWTWTCGGINGGNSASCSAQKQATLQPSGWKEVTP